MTGIGSPLILVTGASGFLGRATLAALAGRHVMVRAVSRQPREATEGVSWFQADLARSEGWAEALAGVDTIVHLAGNPGKGSDRDLMIANAETSGRLASVAAGHGVRRFVYVSSIRVYGHAGRIDETTPVDASDGYGRSKFAGEEAVTAAAGHAMGVSILRPAFVYGADRGGLLRIMMSAARYGVPMPLSGLANRRSMIASDNLGDLLATAAVDRRTDNYALPVAEDGAWTYERMLEQFALLLGRRPRTFSLPPALFRNALRPLASAETLRRLLEDCVVDASAVQRRLEWAPPFAATEIFRRMLHL